MKIRIGEKIGGGDWIFSKWIEIKTKPVAINARFAQGFHTTNHYKKAKNGIHLEFKSQWNYDILNGDECAIEIKMEQGRADIDAYIKIILDALQGVVYENDRQVKKLSVEII